MNDFDEIVASGVKAVKILAVNTVPNSKDKVLTLIKGVPDDDGLGLSRIDVLAKDVVTRKTFMFDSPEQKVVIGDTIEDNKSIELFVRGIQAFPMPLYVEFGQSGNRRFAEILFDDTDANQIIESSLGAI